MTAGQNQFWAATSGGVLNFDPATGEITKFSNIEGLGDNDIYPSAWGNSFFWFGSSQGKLTRYDPVDHSWRQFPFVDRDGSPLQIKAIYTDGIYLWVATNIGVSLFDTERHGGEIKETYRRFGEIPSGSPVRDVIIISDTVWVSTSNGFALASKSDPNLLDFTHWRSYDRANFPDLPADNITKVFSFKGEIWVATPTAVAQLLRDAPAWAVGTELFLPRPLYSSIISSDTIYLGCESGLLLSWSDGIWNTIAIPDLDSTISALALNSGRGLLVGSSGQGIFVQTSQGWTNLVTSGPARNQVIGLAADSQGRIWLAHDNKYISRFDGQEWSNLEMPYGTLLSLAADNNGYVWLGTHGGGIFKIGPDDQWLKYDTSNSSLMGNSDNHGLSYIVVYDMAFDSNGILWFACYRGHVKRPISFYSAAQEQWDYYAYTGFNPEAKILTLYSDGSKLWTGFEDDGIYLIDYGNDPFNHTTLSYTHYTRDALLPSENVRVIRADRNGLIWVGTDLGLAYFDTGINRFIRAVLPEGIGPQINCLGFDIRNNMWVGTPTGLAFRPAGETEFQAFTTSNSLLVSDQIYAFAFDQERRLWVGTDKGLSVLSYDIGPVTDDVTQVVAYPNPFVITEAGEKVFFSFIEAVQVSIYTLDGSKVKTLMSNFGWDGTNESGEKVASGLYLFYLQDKNGISHTGKLAVIRE